MQTKEPISLVLIILGGIINFIIVHKSVNNIKFIQKDSIPFITYVREILKGSSSNQLLTSQLSQATMIKLEDIIEEKK